MFSLETIGFTIQTIGEVLIAVAVLRMHGKLSKEHKIDKKVITTIHQEKIISYLAIALIVLGFVLQLPTIETL